MFIEGEFSKGANLALNELEQVINNQNSPPEVIGRVAVGVISHLFIAFDGIGTALERLANSVEKLEQFAAIDLNATVEQAIADRTENIEKTAVEKFQEAAAKRIFIGKAT